MKQLLFVALLFILVGPLAGQTDKPNYGYKLLPVTHEKSAVSKYYQSRVKLAKSTEILAVDYRSLMPPVLDQGNQGSCVAFSYCYGLSYLNNQKYGYSLTHQYSKAFIYNLPGSTLYGGMAPSQAGEVLQESGYVQESLFPYNPNSSEALPSLDVLKKGIKGRISGWSWFFIGDTLPRPTPEQWPIPIPGYGGINKAKALLAAGKTVVLGLSLTAGYGGAMANENWVYSYAKFGHLPFTGAHSLYLVGYNDTAQTVDGPGYFIAINSWGADKFDQGYCKITYKMLALTNYQHEFSTFDLRDNYQPKLTATLELENFGFFWIMHSGLKVSGEMRNQPLWKYRIGRMDQHFLDTALIDLTDIAQDLDPNGQNIFFIDGSFSVSHFGSNKPTIKGLRITDSSRGIDVYASCNIVVQDSVFHMEWTFNRSTLTDVENVPDVLPNEYSLSQNYPNPFNPTTTVTFSLPKSGHVSLKVFNLLGQEVASLIDEEKTAGTHNANFVAGNLASGIYLYTLQANGFSATRKMILMK